MGQDKEVNVLFDLLKRQGWAVSKTGGQHFKLMPPHKDMGIVIASYTPSDRRVLANIKSDVRRSYLRTGRQPPL